MSKFKMSKEFIGRDNDLAFLENNYKKAATESQLIILTGEIRVGKTRLIKTFYNKKPHIYFNCNKGSSQDQLETAVDYFANEFEDTLLDKKSIADWNTFFKYLSGKLKLLKVQFVIIFDEFQNLIESDKNIVETFLNNWETYLQDKNLLLILSSSDKNLINKYNFIKNTQGLAIPSWNVENFDFETTKKCFSDQNFEKIFSVYTLTGGVPAYLHEINGKKNLKEIILQTFLDKSSYLSIEAYLLLNQEFNDSKIYLTVFKAIGLGGQKFADLAQKTGLASNQLSVYLNNLIKLGFIKRVLAVTILDPDKSKKGLYLINNYFLRFYFSYIFTNTSLIESGNLDTLFKNNQLILDKLISLAYHEYALEMISSLSLNGKIATYKYLGKWWNEQENISVLGFNLDNGNKLFVDVFWKNRLVGIKDLDNLKQKARSLKWESDYDKNCKFGLVSNTGFSLELLKLSKIEDIILIKEDKFISN